MGREEGEARTVEWKNVSRGGEAGEVIVMAWLRWRVGLSLVILIKARISVNILILVDGRLICVVTYLRI